MLAFVFVREKYVELFQKFWRNCLEEVVVAVKRRQSLPVNSKTNVAARKITLS